MIIMVLKDLKMEDQVSLILQIYLVRSLDLVEEEDQEEDHKKEKMLYKDLMYHLKIYIMVLLEKYEYPVQDYANNVKELVVQKKVELEHVQLVMVLVKKLKLEDLDPDLFNKHKLFVLIVVVKVK